MEPPEYLDDAANRCFSQGVECFYSGLYGDATRYIDAAIRNAREFECDINSGFDEPVYDEAWFMILEGSRKNSLECWAKEFVLKTEYVNENGISPENIRAMKEIFREMHEIMGVL